MAELPAINMPSVVTAAWPAQIASTSVMATGQAMVEQASSFMDELRSAASFPAPSINPSFPLVDAAPKINEVDAPTLKSVTWSTFAEPQYTIGPAPDISSMMPTAFKELAPTLAVGAMPTPDFGDAPAQPSVDLNFAYPTLDITLPTPPQSITLSVMPFNGVDLPTFSASAPTFTAVVPNIVPYAEGARYTSTLLSSLSADLTNAINTGQGLVVGGDVENAMWDRAREREYRQQADALLDLDRMEELGFAFPPGVYLDARLKVQTETNNTIAGLSRDIAIKQAETLLENLKAARAAAVELEGKQIDYTNQIAQRAFETCKFVADTAIQIYNAQVETFKASLDGYRTQASVFQTLMQAAQVKVDIYKAELEGEKLKVDMNTTLVQNYTAQIQAQQLFVDIYKAELGAVETKANIQKIIVEAYSAEIQAFLGKVNAYTSEVEAYKAQLQSQELLTNVFKTKVDAYSAQVHAGAELANATIEGYKAQISGYTAQLEGYKTSVTAMAEQVRAATEYNTSAADVFRSETQAMASYNQVLTEQWKAVATINEQIAEVATKALEAQGQMYVSSKNVTVEALKGGGQVAAQIGAAALSAVHWSQSSSWSSSLSNSLASSFSESVSASDSTSASA